MKVDALVLSLIEQFISSGDSRLRWIAPGVADHQFLPLYVGWSAVFGLRPDGSLVRWDFEVSPDRVSELDSPFWKRMALFQGAKQYRQLAGLLPMRPSNAEVCRLCNGSGEVPGRKDLVCDCGGAGWIIAGEMRDSPPG